ncbi:hypothetical protein ES705_06396 [subsurface metagenome]
MKNKNIDVETFPSKVDPEISAIDQDPQITKDDNIPRSFEISFTQDEIDFLDALIVKDQNSLVWYTKIKRIRMTLQSIAHQIKAGKKKRQAAKSTPKLNFDIDDFIDKATRALDAMDIEDDPEPVKKSKKQRPYVDKGFHSGSPFI